MVTRRRRRTLALLALSLGVLALQVEPAVRFVDFIGFSMRARQLWEGLLSGAPVRLVDPLYPVGYPLLLAGTRAVVGDVLLAGKILAVVAGTGAVLAAARLLGPAAGLLLLGLPATLRWGSTEGTDMAAAALALLALAMAGRQKPVAAGLLVGCAMLVRYTAVAVLPVALLGCGLRGGRPLRFLGAVLVATAPHWAIALWTGAPVLPDQGYNLAIAAGRPTGLLSLDTLGRWPHGLLGAFRAALDGWLPIAGLGGLLLGVLRRDRRAAMLLGYGCLHLGVLGLAFANERLALPATLCFCLGGAFILPGRLLAPVSAVLLLLTLLRPAEPIDHLARLDAVVQATAGLQGPFIASDPWFHSRREGWLQQGVPPRMAGPDRELRPEDLIRFAHQHGFAHLVMDPVRVRRTYPGLSPLLGDGTIEGLVLVRKIEGWRVWRVEDPRPGPAGRRPP